MKKNLPLALDQRESHTRTGETKTINDEKKPPSSRVATQNEIKIEHRRRRRVSERGKRKLSTKPACWVPRLSGHIMRFRLLIVVRDNKAGRKTKKKKSIQSVVQGLCVSAR